MARHTPGPWSYWPGYVRDGGMVIQDAAGTHVAAPAVRPGFTGANGRLIAAAPQLLEALENYVMTIAVGGGNDRHEFMAKIREADNAARAAIKAARGRK